MAVRIFYLVLGLPSGGRTKAPAPEEFQQWEHFIVDLNDPETEIIAYDPKAVI